MYVCHILSHEVRQKPLLRQEEANIGTRVDFVALRFLF